MEKFSKIDKAYWMVARGKGEMEYFVAMPLEQRTFIGDFCWNQLLHHK